MEKRIADSANWQKQLKLQWNEYFSIWHLFEYLGYLTTLNNTIFYEQRYNEGW